MRETSLAQYRRIEASGVLSALRLLVTRDVAEHGPTTAAESWRRLQGRNRSQFKDSISPRFSELEAYGVIAVVGKRECGVTAKTSLIWDLTGNLPVKPEPRPTKAEAERWECRRIALAVAQMAQTEQGRRAAQKVARMIGERA